MTTTALDASVRMAPARGRFFTGLHAACLVCAVAGFAPTYWLPLVSGTLNVSAITHLHAGLFFGWLVFAIMQSALVASGRIARHREVGMAGISLATAMVFVGLAATIQRIAALEAAGQGEAARRFAVVPITAVVFFAALFALAIRHVRNPAVHKRLMVVTSVSLLQPALGRLLRLAAGAPLMTVDGLPPPPPSVAFSIVPGLAGDLFLVAAMVHDRRTTGRVHPAYWLAGGALLAVQVLRVPLSGTDLWLRLTHWLTAFAH
jgi:hypothetical protein